MTMTTEQCKEAARQIAIMGHRSEKEEAIQKCKHEEIERQIEEFLANGGEIEVLPSVEPDNRYYKPCGFGNTFSTGANDV